MQELKKQQAMKIAIPLTLFLLLTQSCNLPLASQPALTPTPIFLLNEQNQELPSNSQTIEPSSFASITPQATITPTGIQQPSHTPTTPPGNLPPVNALTLSFKPGGTTAYDAGQITSQQKITYIVNASEGQTMIIGVSSTDHDVYLSIQGSQTGETILSSDLQKTDWTGTLPATQDYLITLSTKNQAVNYFLNLDIPANILFVQGSDSLTINGHLEVHEDLHPDLITHVSYLAYAVAGQTMTINIYSTNLNSLSLGIYGQSDGQPYKRYEVKGTSGILELPVTQGYYIKVYSTDGISTDFTLDITIK